MNIRLLKQKLAVRCHQVGPALAIAILASAVGFFTLQASHATTFVATKEAESGTQTGNYGSGDAAGASGSASVKFGTVSPNPTPPGSGTQTCPAYPAFPDAVCTGVPTGIALTTVNGDVTLGTAGMTYDAKDVKGKIYVSANNVKITRSYIQNGIRLYDQYNGLVVEDSELGTTGASSGDDGIAFDNYTCRRCDIHGFSDGGKVNGNVLIEDSWIHDNFEKPGDHNDGLQSVGGGSVTIRHSHIDVRPANTNDNGNAALFFANQPSGTMIIENNLLAGGQYTIQLRDIAGYTGTVSGNRFVRGSFSYGTHVVSDGDTNRITWSNNAYSDNGQVVNK